MKNKKCLILNKSQAHRVGLGILIAGTGINASAELYDVEGNTVQTATADAVQQVCVSIVTNQGGNNSGSADEQTLLQRCGEMVRSARAIQGNTDFNDELGLEDEAGILAALLQLAPEENAVMAAGATDTSHDQVTSITNRLQLLRTGSSTAPIVGINLSGADFIGGAAGDDTYSRLGVFLNTTYGFGDKDQSREEAGFDFDSYGITGGVDYRFNDSLVAGVALSYTESTADMDENFGETEAEGYSLSIYGSYYLDNFYLDGLVSYGEIDYDSDRNIIYGAAGSSAGQVNEKVSSNTDGEQINWALSAGYTWASGAWNTDTFIRLEGLELDVDAYDEKGSALAMRVDDQDIESLQAILGTQISISKSADFGVYMPYAMLEYHHEFDDDARIVTAQYVADVRNQAFSFKSDNSDDSFAVFSLGVNVVLQQGNQVFFNYDTVMGLDDVTSHVLTLGLRMEL